MSAIAWPVLACAVVRRASSVVAAAMSASSLTPSASSKAIICVAVVMFVISVLAVLTRTALSACSFAMLSAFFLAAARKRFS